MNKLINITFLIVLLSCSRSPISTPDTTLTGNWIRIINYSLENMQNVIEDNINITTRIQITDNDFIINNSQKSQNDLRRTFDTTLSYQYVDTIVLRNINTQTDTLSALKLTSNTESIYLYQINGNYLRLYYYSGDSIQYGSDQPLDKNDFAYHKE